MNKRRNVRKQHKRHEEEEEETGEKQNKNRSINEQDSDMRKVREKTY